MRKEERLKRIRIIIGGNNTIKKADVDKAVIDFCMEVIKNPLIHFNESDLHLLLAEKLFDRIPCLKELKCTNLKLKDGSDAFYKTRLLHREYGAGQRRAIDIIIFNDDDVKGINHPNLTKKTKKDYFPPCFAFELANEKISLDFEKVEKHLSSDGRKLERCTNTGYIIHIVRDTNRRKNQRKKDKIKKFQELIETYSGKQNDKIKIIAIVLNLFGKEDDIKCEIFDKRKTKTDCWKKYETIDNQDVENIEKLLKFQLK